MFIAKFETPVDKNVFMPVYFENKHQKYSTCVSLLSTCVCIIRLKTVPSVIEILAKQHRGHIWDT